MKRFGILLTLLAVPFLVTSCSCDPCSEEAREKLAQEIEAQIKAFDARIKELKADAANLGQEAQVEMEKVVAMLAEMNDDAAKKLEELKANSSEAWTKMEPELKEALKNMKSAFEKAKESFK